MVPRCHATESKGHTLRIKCKCVSGGKCVLHTLCQHKECVLTTVNKVCQHKECVLTTVNKVCQQGAEKDDKQRSGHSSWNVNKTTGHEERNVMKPSL